MLYRLCAIGGLLWASACAAEAQEPIPASSPYRTLSEACDSIHAHPLQYFSVKGKYPESSEALVSRANAFLRERGIRNSQSGYLTYRFLRQKDHICDVTLFQADANYQPTTFDEPLVQALYAFVQSLLPWPPGRQQREGQYKLIDTYATYLSFGIRNGHVETIAP